MTRPLRLAVIGVGDVAYRDYLPQIGRIADLGRVELVVSRNEERARRAAQDFDVPRFATNWRDALAPEFDAVLNLTPAPAHGVINLALAEAGRHFYSEKPFAKDLAEGTAIRAAAARHGAIIAAAPSVMVYPQIQKAIQLLEHGELGRVHSARANATTPPPPWRSYHSDHAPYFSAEVGPLSDMGVYPLHAIVGLLGDVTEVTASSRRTRDGFVVTEGPHEGVRVPVEVDDNWQLILSLAGDALVSVQVAFCVAQAASCHLEISGEKGTMTIGLLDPAVPLRIQTAARGAWEEPVTHARSDGPDHILGVAHLLECIIEGRSPVLSTRQALHVIAVRAATEAAAASGTRVSIPPIASDETT